MLAIVGPLRVELHVEKLCDLCIAPVRDLAEFVRACGGVQGSQERLVGRGFRAQSDSIYNRIELLQQGGNYDLDGNRPCSAMMKFISRKGCRLSIGAGVSLPALTTASLDILTKLIGPA